MKGWILAPENGITKLPATIKLLDLLPSMIRISQVWQVELTDNIKVSDIDTVTADKVTYLQKYDLMSVIYDVSALVTESFDGLEMNDGFTRADGIGDYVCGVRSMEGVINNAVYGFVIAQGQEAREKKRAKYNGCLEHAVKTSNPNSLVSG